MLRSEYLKTAFVLYLLFFAIKADIKRDCRKETNVSWAALKRLKAGNFDENDGNLKCYVQCFMLKNGFIDANSNINMDKCLRHLPLNLHSQARGFLNRCKSVPGKDACDKAFEIVRCYVKEEPQILNNVPFV